jgi:hypothetical protein
MPPPGPEEKKYVFVKHIGEDLIKGIFVLKIPLEEHEEKFF